ncbi:MAG: hypothetical protein WAW23_11555 [Candidatus Methanoperedens sp.]
MNDFLDRLLKIRSGFSKRMRFLFLLDLISVFSIFYAIFIIFQVEYFLNKSTFYLPFQVKFVPPVTAFIIAIIIALMLHKKDGKIDVNMLIERKHIELKEKLRTAYDSKDETNAIVDSLKDDVSSLLANVSSSHLLPAGKIVLKLLITTIFISGVATVSLDPEKYTIPVDSITNITSAITGTAGDGTNETMQVVGRPENVDKVGAKGGGDIFGKPKIASIEGKNIDLTLYSGMGTGFEVRDASQTMYQFIRSAAFPVDVLGSNVSDGGYSILMKKTETEKKLIENYAVERSKI